MVKAYFEDIEKVISSSISVAKKRIYVAVAWFTNEILFSELIKALQRNVEVKVLILDDVLNRNEFGLDFGVLVNYGANVHFASLQKSTMHNKFCVVDNKIITGSYNWTYYANRNNENVILTDNPDVVMDYCNEFENLFNTASPIKLPYEHLKWIDVKEGDFSELRRNIFREVISHNDINRDLKRVKLINIDHAYKSGNKEDLQKASSLPIIGHLKTITDVLTSRKQDFIFKLWERNDTGKPNNNGDRYSDYNKWFFVPHKIEENKYHQTYVEGVLKTCSSLNYGLSKVLHLKVYDEEFIKVIRSYWRTKSYDDYELIPSQILIIEQAKLCYYKFPAPMYNKSQSQIQNGAKTKASSAINILAIAKEVDGDNIVFYDGWDPQKRGEKIMKEFFVKAL